MRIISALHLTHHRRRQYAIPFGRTAAALQYVLLVACAVLLCYIAVQYVVHGLRVSNVLLDVRRNSASLTPEQYRIDAAYLQKNLPFAIGDHLWQLNLAQIRQQLLGMPWVRDVTVRVVLPNSIFLAIDEHVPVAVQQNADGQAMLIGQDGQKIAPPTTHDKDLLHVFGAGSERIISEKYLLDAVSQFEIKKAIRVGHRRWSLELKNGVMVRLPEHGAPQALQRLAALQQNYKILDRAIKVVDLRTTDRTYVELLNTSSEPSPE